MMTESTTEFAAPSAQEPDVDATETAGAEADHRTPDAETLEVARLIKVRLGRRTAAPVRVSFIGAHDDDRDDDTDPPLARLLRGGRGGEVRLKLELSFLWFAAALPHDVSLPARVWAVLLGLEDPEARGTRRVRQAIDALEGNDLIRVERHPGTPPRIWLLDEGAQGVPYTLPGAAFNAARSTPDVWRHRYIQLPDTLWTNGWIATLSGAAIAMLLVLCAERGTDKTGKELWFSPKRADQLYGLSEDTRSKGLRELRAAGLVTARRRSASRNALDTRRVRNTYKLVDARFDEPANVPVKPEPLPPTSADDMLLLDSLREMMDGKKRAQAERRLGVPATDTSVAPALTPTSEHRTANPDQR
jgi:DNA-binding transcriptional ArsR family regulator